MTEAHRQAFIGAALAFALCPLASTAAQSPSPVPPQVPVASFYPPEPATPAEAAVRHARSEHFRPFGSGPLAEDEQGNVHIFAHRNDVLDDKGLVDVADAIFRGTVEAASAFLTHGRETVYSEFRIRVEEVLKDDALSRVPPPLQAGDAVTVVREGGALQLPSGRVVRQFFNAQQLPEVGGQYVVFVTRAPEAQAFVIITGHEVKGEEVTPLEAVFWFPKYPGSIEAFQQRILSLATSIGS